MSNSIRSRFGFSVFANLLKSAIAFSTGLLIARSLGPDKYGDMVFLLGTFTAARQLLDMGTSTAFFTFVSQRKRCRRFVYWYFLWLGFQFFLVLSAVGLLFPSSLMQLIWKGEQRSLVMLAFVAVFMQTVMWSTILQLAEARRLTRQVQGSALIVALAHLILMMWAGKSGWLSIEAVFLLLIVEWGIAGLFIILKLNFEELPDENETFRSVVTEFWRYCRPLILYAWVSFAYEFADRWLLQTYAGSVQQAYYSVAYQIGAIAAIATASILNIFWKEISEAYYQKNIERVAMLYKKVSRGLFFVASVGAGFFAPWAEDILRVTLGANYIGGKAALVIMFFYPLHQSMGQICGVMSYGTGRVATHARIGMIGMGLSMAVTYFVLANPSAMVPGLGLGSSGLAGKMVVMQLLSVNVLAFYLSKSLGIKYDWLFQPAAIVACVVAGLLAYSFTHEILNLGSQFLIAILLSGALYSVLIVALIFLMPSLAGLCRANVVGVIDAGIGLLHK